jgi:hypothetical protein
VRSEELSDVRQEFAEWSEPIIADYLYEAYAERMGAQTGTVRTLVTSHCRFWRALLTGNEAKFATYRRELASLARLAGMPVTLIDAIDVGMLDELMNVCISRFLRSPSAARDYSHFMLRTAAHLSRAHIVPA